MAYPYVCDACLDWNCQDCESSENIPTDPEMCGGGICVCAHGNGACQTDFEYHVRSRSLEVQRRHR